MYLSLNMKAFMYLLMFQNNLTKLLRHLQRGINNAFTSILDCTKVGLVFFFWKKTSITKQENKNGKIYMKFESIAVYRNINKKY